MLVQQPQGASSFWVGRIETALIARRNVLEIIPGYAYRQPIVTGEMLIRWHMMADPGGMKRVMLDNLANYPKSEIIAPDAGTRHRRKPVQRGWRGMEMAAPGRGPGLHHRNVVALAPAMSATAGGAPVTALARGGRQGTELGGTRC